MEASKVEVESEDHEPRTILNTLRRFITGAIKAVIRSIPATFIAIIVGAIIGGFLGLAVLPLAPLFAVGGAVLLGVPVAIWEYILLSREESPWDYII